MGGSTVVLRGRITIFCKPSPYIFFLVGCRSALNPTSQCLLVFIPTAYFTFTPVIDSIQQAVAEVVNLTLPSCVYSFGTVSSLYPSPFLMTCNMQLAHAVTSVRKVW